MLCRRISSRRAFWALADIAAEGVLAGAELLLTFAVRPAAVRVSRAVICLHAASQTDLRRTQMLTSQSIGGDEVLRSLTLHMDPPKHIDTGLQIPECSILTCKS